MRRTLIRLLPLLLPAAAFAQGGAPAAAPAKPVTVPPAAEQIAAAVSVLPAADLKAGATVLGYSNDHKLVELRKGTGDFTCLGNDPASDQFHVACYHNSMAAFMARGRELRAQGVKGAQVDSVRFKEVREGKLAIAKDPATMYQVFGGKFDAAKGELSGAEPLYVVYIPMATAKSTGLSPKPNGKLPWIMFPGTPKAHIMFSPGM